MLWTDVFRGLNWEPFTGLKRLQQEMNRQFGEGNGDFVEKPFPAVNVYTGKDDVLVTAEIPGVDPGTIDVSVLGNTLTISGNRLAEDIKEDDVCHREERIKGEFHRTLELPVKVDPDKVDAKYARGSLQVRLPRHEEDKPRQIKVEF